MNGWRGPVALLSVGAALGWLAHGIVAPPPLNDSARNTAIAPAIPVDANRNDPPRAATDDAAGPLRGYLESGHYEEAVQWLVESRAAGQHELAGEQDVLVLKDYVSALATEGRGSPAQDLLTQIITALPAFIDVRLLLAQLQAQEKMHEDSVATLYSGRLHVATLEELQRIESAIQQNVAASHRQLVACCDAARRIAFYQQLVSLDPSAATFHLALAEAYAEDGQIGAARDTLAVVIHDPEAGAQARTLLAALEGRTANGTKIPLQRRGNQYQLNAVFNDRVELSLLLDTGASMTVLSATAFDALRSAATPLGERALTTANGIVVAQVFRIPSLAVGGRRVNDLDIAVVEQLDEGGLVGLLGMDYLDNFQFSIDRQDDALYLM